MELFNGIELEVLGNAEQILEHLNKIEEWAEKEGFLPRIKTGHKALDENRIGIFRISIFGVPEEKKDDIAKIIT